VTVAWSVSVSGLPSGNTAPARVVSFKPFKQGDAALLKIEAQNLTPLLFADSADISTGTEVVSVGYPASVGSVSDANLSDPSFKSGTVSSIRTIENGLLPVYEVSSALSGGMSGGPTVDLNGDVIGVNSYSPRGEAQQFNFIQPIQSLRELMADAGVTGELGEVGTAYHEGLDAYFAGSKAAAVTAFRKVLELQPSHALAQQYLRLSQELPNPPKPAETSILPWVLAGVGSSPPRSCRYTSASSLAGQEVICEKDDRQRCAGRARARGVWQGCGLVGHVRCRQARPISASQRGCSRKDLLDRREHVHRLRGLDPVGD
jgi:hypothetical protein